MRADRNSRLYNEAAQRAAGAPMGSRILSNFAWNGPETGPQIAGSNEVRKQFYVAEAIGLGEISIVRCDECRPVLLGNGMIERIEEMMLELN